MEASLTNSDVACCSIGYKSRAFNAPLITSHDSGRWVIPMTWPMPGEEPHQVAERVAYEEAGVTHHRARVATKSPLGEELAYIAKYWDSVKLFLTDRRIEIDNNSVERTIRPIALNRKNALFAGHDAGAENWATIASLIETCKLNAVDPLAYLSATLAAIVDGQKQNRIEQLLPWNDKSS